MTTTPDYAAIDWVLKNVEGARPKKPSPTQRLLLLYRDDEADRMQNDY